MSLENPNATRLADPFDVIDALGFDRTGGYQRFFVPGLHQPAQPGKKGQLSDGEELDITFSVVEGDVGVATFEPRNWPQICKPYMAWFLGDLYSFGQALDYDRPQIDPNTAAERSLVFTLQKDGKLRCALKGMEHTFDLYQCGATNFYITLRRRPVFSHTMTLETNAVAKKQPGVRGAGEKPTA